VVRGVDEPIEHALGDDCVGEQRIPVNGRAVRGEDQRPAGLSFGDELVEVVGLHGGEVAHGEVVEDEHVGSRPSSESGTPGAVGVSAGEVWSAPKIPDSGSL
jgi:hypothetical protein